MSRGTFLLALSMLCTSPGFSQGVGIPSNTVGIGFGNLPVFAGIRFNFIDRNVEKISGINVTVWQPKSDADQTGTMHGISIGLPLAMGTESRSGIGLGVAGVGARNNLSGLNIGGLGVGAGGNVSGITVGGLGVGTRGDLKGINIGGLGAGSGGDVTGFNFGGLGIGAGKNLTGISIGGLGVGSGGKVTGISIGGLGVGASDDVTGISVAVVGVGSGARVSGISIAGVGLGAGKEVRGLAIAGLGVGSPKIRGIVISAASGGMDLGGLFINPIYLAAGDKHSNPDEVSMKGLSVSAFNRIRGTQKGLTIGVINYTKIQRGIQLGILNYVEDNPKGLRWLPVFNKHFGKRQDTAK